MTSKDLNLRMIEALPQITKKYVEETEWQEKDETGSHVVYADVFVPFVYETFTTNDEVLLTKIFQFIENLIKLKDDYADEVVHLSVLEKLYYEDEIGKKQLECFMKSETLKKWKTFSLEQK
ncbi:MAG: hypothetical protein LBL34_06530 [Clostridiales bacterium]|jgi:hypothetical protein|nr:hypothetical protein [Clostridiales bacterium]